MEERRYCKSHAPTSESPSVKRRLRLTTLYFGGRCRRRMLLRIENRIISNMVQAIGVILQRVRLASQRETRRPPSRRHACDNSSDDSSDCKHEAKNPKYAGNRWRVLSPFSSRTDEEACEMQPVGCDVPGNVACVHVPVQSKLVVFEAQNVFVTHSL